MAKINYSLVVNEHVVATRKSDKKYTHGYVLYRDYRGYMENGVYVKTPCDHYVFRCGFAGSFDLAHKAMISEAKYWGASLWMLQPVTINS